MPQPPSMAMNQEHPPSPLGQCVQTDMISPPLQLLDRLHQPQPLRLPHSGLRAIHKAVRNAARLSQQRDQGVQVTAAHGHCSVAFPPPLPQAPHCDIQPAAGERAGGGAGLGGSRAEEAARAPLGPPRREPRQGMMPGTGGAWAGTDGAVLQVPGLQERR